MRAEQVVDGPAVPPWPGPLLRVAAPAQEPGEVACEVASAGIPRSSGERGAPGVRLQEEETQRVLTVLSRPFL